MTPLDLTDMEERIKTLEKQVASARRFLRSVWLRETVEEIQAAGQDSPTITAGEVGDSMITTNQFRSEQARANKRLRDIIDATEESEKPNPPYAASAMEKCLWLERGGELRITSEMADPVKLRMTLTPEEEADNA